MWLFVSDFQGNLGVIIPPGDRSSFWFGHAVSARLGNAGRVRGRRGLVGRPALVELCDAAEASEHLLCPHVHTTAP